MESKVQGRLMRVRCPHCQKLFGVDPSELKGSFSRFACARCEKHFELSSDDVTFAHDIVGRPVPVPTPVVAPAASPEAVTAAATQSGFGAGAMSVVTNECPRCQTQYRAGDQECPKCGVVFAKLKYFLPDGPIEASPELRRHWWHVLEDYENLEKHHRFLRAAQREGRLLYAAQQYRRVLEADGSDEIALRMKGEVQALSSVHFAPAKLAEQWRRLTLPRLSTFFMLMGAALMALGLVHEVARNLVGLGAAVLFFTASVRWYLQSQQ